MTVAMSLCVVVASVVALLLHLIVQSGEEMSKQASTRKQLPNERYHHLHAMDIRRSSATIVRFCIFLRCAYYTQCPAQTCADAHVFVRISAGPTDKDSAGQSFDAISDLQHDRLAQTNNNTHGHS